MNAWKNKEAGRQTDRQKKQAGRQTGLLTDILTDTEGQTDRVQLVTYITLFSPCWTGNLSTII